MTDPSGKAGNDPTVLHGSSVDCEARYRSLFETAIDGIFVLADGRFADCNPAALELFRCGRDGIVGRRPEEVSPAFQPDGSRSVEAARNWIDHALAGHDPRFEWVHRRADGTDFHAEVSLSAYECLGAQHITAVVRDVSARKRAERELSTYRESLERLVKERTGELELAKVNLEEQLRSLRKYETLGRVVGGIAHDFNNLLAVVVSFSDILLDRLGPSSPMSNDIQQIRNAGIQAVDLTRQLLVSSRRQEIAIALLDVNQVIRDIQCLLQRLIGEEIEIVLHTSEDACCVKADRSRLVHLVLNLAVNARDAMPGGGTITVETGRIELVGTSVYPDRDLPPGAYVRIAMIDSGNGSDERVFEPLFPAREPGSLLDTGLETLKDIVDESGGAIRVSTTPGAGALYEVLLPAVEAGRPTVVRPRKPSREGGARPGATVLVVEDSAPVRQAVARMLDAAGFRVVEASCGDEALVVAGQEGSIDLLFTDVVLRGMSGPDLAQRLAVIRPGLRVLFTSGYADNAIARHGVDVEDGQLIAKPFSADELVERVREILAEDE